MSKKRAPKYTHFKAADWDKYVRVKKGEAEYTIARAAPPEDKVLYGVGVIPFGFSPSTDANAKNHKKATINFAGAKVANSCLGSNFKNILGIEETRTNITDGPTGWYPAILTLTLVGINDRRSRELSQLSTRRYRKRSTRSGSMPFGRRTIPTPSATTGGATTTVEDRDYKDCLDAIKAAIEDTPGSPTGSKVQSKSSEPEIYVPIVAFGQYLSALNPIPDVTAF